MKRTTKTLMAILLMISGSIAFTACQEEVYPDLHKLDVVDSNAITDADSETEDEEEDDGMDPK